MVEKEKSHKVAIIILCVVSVIIIVASVVAVVLNHQKNAPTDIPGQQNSQADGVVKLSPEDFEKNEKIIQEINDYILPLDEEEAAKYLDQKSEEYRSSSVGLAVAQIKVNMFYNALQYERAEQYGLEVEENYDLDKYPTIYVLRFYYEMMEIYKALGDEEKAETYNNMGKELSDKYFGGGPAIYGED